MKDNRSKLLGSVGVSAGVLAALMAISLYQATRWVPPFYAKKLALDAHTLAIGDHEMQQQVLNLQSDVLERNEWQAVFSDAQINGWLAGGLQKTFPRAIPAMLSTPRVAITSGEAKLACQYTDHKPPTVVSLVMDAFLTDQQNVIGLRLKSTRFGAVPGFMDEVIRHLSLAARRSRIPLRWTQMDGDPVALVSISPMIVDQNHLLTLASFELRDGAVYIAGRTTVLDIEETTQTAIHDGKRSVKQSARRSTTQRTIQSSSVNSSSHR